MTRPILIVSRDGLVRVGHAENSALLDVQNGTRLDYGSSIRIGPHLDQLVLSDQLFLQRDRLGAGQRRRKNHGSKKRKYWNQIVRFPRHCEPSGLAYPKIPLINF